MAHLSPETLIDLVEDVLAPADRARAAAHLDACAPCREQFAEARQMLAAVTDVGVPEPSPLFWDHLSARVHEAVAAEHSTSWFARFWPLPAGVRIAGVVSACAVAVLAVVLMLPGQPAGSGDERVASATPVVNETEALVDTAAEEASLDLLATLADGMSWDDASEAGLTAAPGAVDDVLMGLTPEERIELQRLLQEELARGGSTTQGALLVNGAVRVQG